MSIKYSLLESDNAFHDEHWVIRLEEGKYQGVEFQFDTVSISNDEEEPTLSFNWVTLKNPNDIKLTEDEFGVTIGDILVEMITEHLEQLDEDRNTDSEAPTQ